MSEAQGGAGPGRGRGGGSDGDRGKPSSSDGGGSAGDDKLAVRLAKLARDLQDHQDVQTTLDAIVHAAVDMVPGVEFASISMVHRRRREVHTRVATSQLPRVVDQAQYDTGQGPCLDSLHERKTVRLNDMANEERWPLFAAKAAELGLGSMLSVQLYVENEDMGALNLQSRQVEAFTDESEHVALLLASHAAVAMTSAQTEEQLQTAMASNAVIEQAKGMIMRDQRCSAEEAFRMLVQASNNSNRRLHDIATSIVQGAQR